MTLLRGARYSCVLLRLKNKVKMLPQSAEKSICMRKWAVPNGGNVFLGLPKGPRRLDFSGASFAPNAIPEKN